MLNTRLLAPLFAMFFSVVLALPANAGLVGTDQVSSLAARIDALPAGGLSRSGSWPSSRCLC